MKYLILLVCFVSKSLAFSQSKTYLDENRWVTKKKHAKYIQTIERIESTKYLLKEILIETGQTLNLTTLNKINPSIKHGDFKAFYMNGRLREEGQYSNDTKTGDWKEYYKNGRPKTIYRTHQDKQLYIQYWDESGNKVLANGNGSYDRKNVERNELSVTVFKDSLMYTTYAVKLASNDTIYDLATKSAEFKYGYPTFYKNVGETMTYPVEAQKGLWVEYLSSSL